MIFTWTCHICGRVRDDADIAVHSHPAPQTVPEQRAGVQVTENVRYCCDNAACAQAAPTFSFFRKDMT